MPISCSHFFHKLSKIAYEINLRGVYAAFTVISSSTLETDYTYALIWEAFAELVLNYTVHQTLLTKSSNAAKWS